MAAEHAPKAVYFAVTPDEHKNDLIPRVSYFPLWAEPAEELSTLVFDLDTMVDCGYRMYLAGIQISTFGCVCARPCCFLIMSLYAVKILSKSSLKVCCLNKNRVFPRPGVAYILPREACPVMLWGDIGRYFRWCDRFWVVWSQSSGTMVKVTKIRL